MLHILCLYDWAWQNFSMYILKQKKKKSKLLLEGQHLNSANLLTLKILTGRENLQISFFFEMFEKSSFEQ